MSTNRTRINNKEKQFTAGNWSANKFIKKQTKIASPLTPEETKGRYSKRKPVKSLAG